MGMVVFNGRFYEFHKERIISRPGAPLETRPGFEVGPEISRADAIRRPQTERGRLYACGAGRQEPGDRRVFPDGRLRA